MPNFSSFNAARQPKTDAEIEVLIAEYLLKNPAPADLQFHAFAHGLGEEKDRVEAIAYRMLSTVLHASVDWNVLNREDKEIETLLYMCNVDVHTQVDEIKRSNPSASQNMAHLCVRLRNADNLKRVTQQRMQVLSYAEEESIVDGELALKPQDRVPVNDSGRIDLVNAELQSLDLDQRTIDRIVRLLELDSFANEATLLNSSYNSLREALCQATDYVFDDERFAHCQRLLKGYSGDRRDQGPQIRIGKIREAVMLMRELTSTYGMGNKGLFSGIDSNR